MNAEQAFVLHSRLQEATRAARQMDDAAATPSRTRRARVSEADAWRLLGTLSGPGQFADSNLSLDRALGRVLSEVLTRSTSTVRPVDLTPPDGPVLIVRSGPWPVLRTLVERLATLAHDDAIVVVCHQQDGPALDELARATGVPLTPAFYPRFEPFNPGRLSDLMTRLEHRWSAAFVLDGAKHGTGRALEHITSAVAALTCDKYVWNQSAQVYRMHGLREALGREGYALVRGLLRWRAQQPAPA